MKKYVLILAALMLPLSFAHAQEAESERLTHMPTWELYTQDGSLVKSSDYAGKPLILHFWATWCPYCKKLQPGLARIHQAYKEQGLEMLAVSFQESPDAKPQDTLDERGLDMLTVVDGDALAIRDFGIQGTPTTFFIAPNGEIVGVTMQSDPNDPRLEQAAAFLVDMPRETTVSD